MTNEPSQYEITQSLRAYLQCSNAYEQSKTDENKRQLRRAALKLKAILQTALVERTKNRTLSAVCKYKFTGNIKIIGETLRRLNSKSKPQAKTKRRQTRAANGERATANGERATANGERATANGESPAPTRNAETNANAASATPGAASAKRKRRIPYTFAVL